MSYWWTQERLKLGQTGLNTHRLWYWQVRSYYSECNYLQLDFYIGNSRITWSDVQCVCRIGVFQCECLSMSQLCECECVWCVCVCVPAGRGPGWCLGFSSAVWLVYAARPVSGFLWAGFPCPGLDLESQESPLTLPPDTMETKVVSKLFSDDQDCWSSLHLCGHWSESINHVWW